MWGGWRIETRCEEYFMLVQLDQMESLLWWGTDKLQQSTGKAYVHKQGTDKTSVLDRIK